VGRAAGVYAPTESSHTAPPAPEAPDDEPQGGASSAWRLYSPFALWGLLALASLYTLQHARAFLFPVVLACILSLVLSPLVQGLKRLKIPQSLGAAVVLIAVLAGTGWAIYGLSAPASAWVARGPQTLKVLERRGREILKPFHRFSETAAQVDSLTSMESEEVTQVEVRGPGLSATLFVSVQELINGALVVVPLLYLLLASGDTLLRGVVRTLPRLRDKKRAVDIARETQRQVSEYLFTMTAINAGLGVAVALAMWAIGLPNPWLWGALAAILSYIPIFGGIGCTAILAVAGLMTFESTRHAMLAPLAFLVLNFIQDYLATPLIMGRRLTLNPIVLFVGVVFWWWIWGVPGGLLAVPMIATLRIFCDRSEALKPIGELIGGGEPAAER
jgi:predicted PurR-regulated permease PerM